MVVDSECAVVLGWGGTLVDDRGAHTRLMPGVREFLAGARAAAIPVIVLTRAAVAEVALQARRHHIGAMLSVVIADVDDPVGELRGLRGEFTRLAFVGGVDTEVAAAGRAGVVAFGYSGGVHSGARLRAAGAESVTPRLHAALALRVTEPRLFAATTGG